MKQTLKELGHAGAQGWRERVADAVAPRVATRTPARQEQIKAAVGLAFVVFSVLHLARTLRVFAKT